MVDTITNVLRIKNFERMFKNTGVSKMFLGDEMNKTLALSFKSNSGRDTKLLNIE